jgi:hypothetical protein
MRPVLHTYSHTNVRAGESGTRHLCFPHFGNSFEVSQTCSSPRERELFLLSSRHPPLPNFLKFGNRPPSSSTHSRAHLPLPRYLPSRHDVERAQVPVGLLDRQLPRRARLLAHVGLHNGIPTFHKHVIFAKSKHRTVCKSIDSRCHLLLLLRLLSRPPRLYLLLLCLFAHSVPLRRRSAWCFHPM